MIMGLSQRFRLTKRFNSFIESVSIWLKVRLGADGQFVLILGLAYVILLSVMSLMLPEDFIPVYFIFFWIIVTTGLLYFLSRSKENQEEYGQLILLYFGIIVMANTIFIQYKNNFADDYIFFYWTMAVSVSVGITNLRYMIQVWAIPLALMMFSLGYSDLPIDERNQFYIWNPVITILSFLGVYTSMKAKRELLLYKEKSSKYQFEFENLMDTMSNLVMIKDDKNRIVRVNKKYAAFSNQSVSFYKGANMYDLLSEKDALRFHQEDLEIINTRKPKLQNLEKVSIYGSDKPAWIRTNKFPYYNQEGEIQGVVIFGTDVTREVAAEREKKRSKARFEQVFAEAPYGIIIFDESKNIKEANKTFSKMLGYERGDLIDKNMQSLFSKVQESDYDSLVLENGFQKELAFETKSKGRFIAKMTVSNVDNHDTELNYSIAIVEDITDKKAAERQLQEYSEALKESNRDLEQFAYIASHDLKEPLRMVNSYVTLLAKMYSHKLDARGLEFINYASDGVTRMNDLIRDLLEYSRVGRGEVQKNKVKFDNVLIKVMSNLRMQINERKVDFDIDVELPPFLANRTQISMLIQNLISNGIKYNENSPLITIKSKLNDGYIEFMVKDNGIGMKKRHLDKIFQIFQRLHGREKYEGTGIGLAVCKRIVKHHGGEIWVESEEGRGSTFYFTIPFEPVLEPALMN
ncbi:MAG: ATP-binding protein [Saprospiraceae bacterium]